ncbi:MAG: retropepsin-like aspartic protease [Chitinophagales bacterium]|nr:retroviral-like aspartic protease family protein [Chitinophagales bacterium]MDW8273764.1 retropepsin-like aspartic protease [Chitinophagales bacterium]
MSKKDTSYKVPLLIKDIRGAGFHVFLKVTVNGKRCVFLLDTGASKTVISKTWYEKNIGKRKLKSIKEETAGLHSSVAESFFGKIPMLEIGKLAIKNSVYAAIDLTHVNSMYKKAGIKPIQGILGSDILLKYKAVIDYGNLVLTLIQLP